MEMPSLLEILLNGDHNIIARRAAIRGHSESDPLDALILDYFRSHDTFKTRCDQIRKQHNGNNLRIAITSILAARDQNAYAVLRALAATDKTVNLHYTENFVHFINEFCTEYAATLKLWLIAIVKDESPDFDKAGLYNTDIKVALMDYALNLNKYHSARAIARDLGVKIAPIGAKTMTTKVFEDRYFTQAAAGKINKYFDTLERGETFFNLINEIGRDFGKFADARGVTLPEVPTTTTVVHRPNYAFSAYNVPTTLEGLNFDDTCLYEFFREELAPMPLASFIGFVEENEAIDYVREYGAFIDADPTALTHGKYTHVLQLLMIKRGISCGKIKLPGHDLMQIARLLAEGTNWSRILDANFELPHWGPMQLTAWFTRQAQSTNPFVQAMQLSFYQRLKTAMDYFKIPDPALCIARFERQHSTLFLPHLSDRFLRRYGTTSLKYKPILGGGIYERNAPGRYTLFARKRAHDDPSLDERPAKSIKP